jgi:hypothetical protein
MKKQKTGKMGRPWDGVKKVKPRISKAVRFTPEDYKQLEKAAKKVFEPSSTDRKAKKVMNVEGFIIEAVRERVQRLLKK